MNEVFSSAVGFTRDSLVVRIDGRGTRDQGPGFVRCVTGMIKTSGGRNLVVDVEGCEFLDSTFLGCLVILFQRAHSRMSLCATEARSQHLFSSARIDRMIPVVRPDEFSGPGQWHSIDGAEDCDLTTLVESVAAAHRCLAEIEGPNAEIYRDVADQLEEDLKSGALR